jgi:ABC-type multidrug transport system ATPase subunit
VSGAGKSTLLNALSGFRPATDGNVLVNGTDLYRNFDAYRTQIGYVPQEDIMHRELSVGQALDYAAQLRLPADTTAAERHRRVAEVLETLDLVQRKDVPIHKLSGGQRKRVSIGVELLTQPGLFFLDEATSGLDPGTESQMMRLLRKLADDGHTILLITHATKNVMLCDLVAFLAKGGNLAYFGPPEEALAYFEVKDFDAIYEKLESGRPPAEWAKRYRQSAQYQRFVVSRLKDRESVVSSAPRTVEADRKAALPGRERRSQLPGAAVKQVSALRQLFILSQRNLSILFRDKASLALMLLIAPLIGMNDFMMWKKGAFDATGGNATHSLTGLFFAALICILVGAIASMREIVKETDIYRRERMVTLKIGPYILSKLWLGALLALYQSAIFVLTKRLAAGWPVSATTVLQVYVTLVLGTLSGMVMGLLISAASPNQSAAPLLLVVILVPQFIFAGGMLPLNTFGKLGEVLSVGVTTRWTFESLVTISGLGRDVANDACWQLPEAQREALTEEEQRSDCDCLGPNVFRNCNFPGVRDFYDPAVDQPEPAKPSKPADLPAQPDRPKAPASDASTQEQQKYQGAMQGYEEAMDDYQKDVEAYQTAMNDYQESIDEWQTRYKDWKEKRDNAIGEAEGLIERLYKDYGSMFKVSLTHHWGMLVAIMAVLFGLVFVVQQRKDVV